MADNPELDELFGEGTGQPEPRYILVILLLAFGIASTLAGLACTAAPGGILVLTAWVIVEKEVDRVESGYLPADDKPRLVRLQRYVQAGLVLVVLLFLLQSLLLCNGFYDWWWGALLHWVTTGEILLP